MDKMKTKESFFEIIKREMGVVLATGGSQRVTMRLVSPVYFDEKILIFTAADSQKYRQLKENPYCCLAAGSFFAEAKAEFCGATMAAENSGLREVYASKFPDAFDESVAFGGRNADFILLTPIKLTGWVFPEGANESAGFPTVPFALDFE